MRATPSPEKQHPWRWCKGLTLIEMMVAIAIAALIAGLAAPSFNNYIVTQRVKSIHAQMATDLQLARSEAVSRSSYVSVRFQDVTGTDGQSCYVIFVRPDPTTSTDTCDCTAAPGARCNTHPTTTSEIRTVSVPRDSRVRLALPVDQPQTLTFDPRTGALKMRPADFTIVVAQGFQIDTTADADRTMRAVVKPSGRAELCAPTGSRLGGTACTP
jgi:prepilin-type N-terminal cleavage/methylation domain-containing protein